MKIHPLRDMLLLDDVNTLEMEGYIPGEVMLSDTEQELGPYAVGAVKAKGPEVAVTLKIGDRVVFAVRAGAEVSSKDRSVLVSAQAAMATVESSPIISVV